MWLCHLATTLYELRVSVTRITDLNSLHAAGAPCRLAALDGRMLTIVGAFLRRSKKEVRRVHRLLWILEAEDADDVRRAAAAARGWRRADHCFVVS